MKSQTFLKPITRISALLLLAICIAGCSVTMSSKTLMSIEKGMSKEQVTKILGTPEFRRFNHDSEEWEYSRMVINNTTSSSTLTVIIIFFSDGRVTGMDSFENYAPTIQTVPIPTPVVHEGRPYQYQRGMNERDFENLLVKIKDRPFKDDKLSLLKLSAENKSFTCKQCVRIMSVFTFDDDKLEVVRILAPQIVDKENYEEIIDTLDFLSSEEKAKKMLGTPKK